VARKTGSDDTMPARRTRGFEPASRLLQRRIEAAGAARGFGVARLLTHWDEVAGADLAAVTRPVRVGHGREGRGATLTVLVAPAHAPLVEMRKEALRSRINALHGYNAIAHIALTQTAAEGFGEGAAPFAHAPRRPPPEPPSPATAPEARALAEDVQDSALRTALAALAQNVFTRARKQKG
jgi:hypothetical protein